MHACIWHLDTCLCKFSRKNTTVCDLHKKEKTELCYTVNSVRVLLILSTVWFVNFV
jgi:hypothetical protein